MSYIKATIRAAWSVLAETAAPRQKSESVAMIRDILVHLGASKASDVARDYAMSITALFDAHLSGVSFAREIPNWASTRSVTAKMIEAWAAEQRAEARNAVQLFEECLRSRGLRAEGRVIADRFGESDQLFSEVARSYDLSVVAQAQHEDDIVGTLLIEGALFNSGRPVLVVPLMQTAGMKLDRVVICWDGSPNAARAVGDAMPFLKHAGKVEVMTIEDKERPQWIRGAAIAEHLARHMLDVELKAFVAPNYEAPRVILDEITDCGADLTVLGAYGHSRFREFVLGGVTRSMLRTMTAPVLMTH